MPQGRPWEYEAIPLDEPTAARPWEAASTDAPQGSAVERFLGGIKNTLIPDVETIKRLVQAATSPPVELDVERDEASVPTVVSGIKSEPFSLWMDILRGGMSQAAEQVKEAREAPSLSAAIGHGAAAALPFVGPAAAEAGERMAEGDVAGGLGEATGLIAPLAGPLRALKIPGRTAGALKRAGRINVGRAASLSAPELASMTPEVAAEVSQKIGVGTRGTLAKRAGTALDTAKSELEATKTALAQNLAPADRVRDLATSLRAGLKEIDPSTINLQAAAQQIMTLPAAQRPAAFQALQSALQKPISMDTALQNAVRGQATKLDQLAALHPAGVPGEKLFAVRSQAGGAASRGGAYAKLPGQPRPAGADAAMKAQAEISDLLHDPQLFPGLAEVDAPYSTWRTTSDALKKAVAREAAGGPPVAEVFAVRNLLGGLLSGGAGAAAAGASGGALGFGGWIVAQHILRSPLWNSLSARSKFLLADALGSMPPGTISKTSMVAAQAGEAATHTMPGGQKMTGATHTQASKPVEGQ